MQCSPFPLESSHSEQTGGETIISLFSVAIGAAPGDEVEEAAAPVGEPLGVGVVDAPVPVIAVLVPLMPPVTGTTVVCPFITVGGIDMLPDMLIDELAEAVALAVEFIPEAEAEATVLGSAGVVAVDCCEPGLPLLMGPPWPPTGRVMR